ncbi:hypothetical protein B0H19DRAFT_1266984 [Mycena capillaripes]|nr:hypothetical protein B0H19DRAFT_1266984 [Mycena capillaripes]
MPPLFALLLSILYLRDPPPTIGLHSALHCPNAEPPQTTHDAIWTNDDAVAGQYGGPTLWVLLKLKNTKRLETSVWRKIVENSDAPQPTTTTTPTSLLLLPSSVSAACAGTRLALVHVAAGRSNRAGREGGLCAPELRLLSAHLGNDATGGMVMFRPAFRVQWIF